MGPTIGDASLWRRYLDLGGETGRLGMPTTDGIDFGGGWNGHHFEHGALYVNAEGRVIGIDEAALLMPTPVWQKWVSMGEFSSALGAPASYHQLALDGVGSVLTFQNGWVIYWAPGMDSAHLLGAGIYSLAVPEPHPYSVDQPSVSC